MALSTIDTSSISGLGYGFKNRLINGSMGIWQRGTSTSTAGTYIADRWFVYSNSGTITGSQSTDVPSGFKYSMSISGSNYPQSAQYIESLNCVDLSGQTVTVSFWAKQTSGAGAGSLGLQLSYANAVDSWGGGNTVIATNTFTGTSSWAQYSYTFTNLPAGALNGLKVLIYGNTSGSATVLFTGVQLEVGTVATSFDWRPYGTELNLCQRYYEKSYPIGTAPGASSITSGMSWLVNGYTATIYVLCTTTFKATKRTGATVTFWDAAGNTGRTTSLTGGGLSQVDNNNNIYATVASESGFFIYILAGSSLNYGVQWTASAEL